MWIPGLVFTSVLILFLIAVFFSTPEMSPFQVQIVLLLYALLAGFSTVFLGGAALLEITGEVRKGFTFAFSATAGIAVFALCYLCPPHFLRGADAAAPRVPENPRVPPSDPDPVPAESKSEASQTLEREDEKKVARFFQDFQNFVGASIRDHWAASLFQQNYADIPPIVSAMKKINDRLTDLEVFWIKSAAFRDSNERWQTIRGEFRGIMLDVFKLLGNAQSMRQELLDEVGAGKGSQKLQKQIQQLLILETNIPVWMQTANRFEAVMDLPGDLD